jgi:F-type H+-transporting ATPase subunit alpha
MPVEDQVVQLYAATNGYLDRITVDKVPKFLAELTAWVRGNEPELLRKIAEGDWEEDTQAAVDKAVATFAEDFGYDLDEEGHPITEDDTPRPSSRSHTDGSSEESSSEQKEEEPVPA